MQDKSKCLIFVSILKNSKTSSKLTSVKLCVLKL